MMQTTMLGPKSIFSNVETHLHNLPVKKTITVLILCLGLTFLFIGLWRGYKNRINPSWSFTYGVILNSSMDSVTVPTIKNNINHTYYKPKITYEYEVNGKTHTKITSAGVITRNEPAIAEKTVKKFSDDRLVKIFYNPEKPEEAIINSFSGMDKWVPISAGMLLIISGLLAVIYLKIEDNIRVDALLKSRRKLPVTRPKSVSKKMYEIRPNNKNYTINGKWELNYQIPSMGEIESLINQKRSDIRSLSSYSILLSIENDKMIFSYKDSGGDGSCEIHSRLESTEDQLILEHQSIDFLLFDIEDFPPKNYTYSLNGSTLVLKTNRIKGLGDREITYNFSKTES